MNKFISILLYFFTSVHAINADDTIYYKLPAKVEADLLYRIQTYMVNSPDSTHISVFLGRTVADNGEMKFYTDILPYDSLNHKNLNTQIAKNTHRYVTIGNQVFPLFLRLDERLGSPTPICQRGKMFNKDCTMKRQLTILEHPIYFQLNENNSVR